MPRTRIPRCSLRHWRLCWCLPWPARPRRAAAGPGPLQRRSTTCSLPGDPAARSAAAWWTCPLHTEIDGYFSVKDRPRRTLSYFADRFRSTLVYTNPQTGLTYTVVRVRQTKDLELTDNGDGTLTLVGLNTGGLFAYGPDGERSAAGPACPATPSWWTRWEPADPFDDELTHVGDPVTAGLHTTTDFCTDFFAATQG